MMGKVWIFVHELMGWANIFLATKSERAAMISYPPYSIMI